MTAPSGELLAVARALACDQVAVEVDGRLRAAGVQPILLKGASLVRWLYRDGTPRGYADVDLLVDPRRIDEARRVLAQLGFATDQGEWGGEYDQHAQAWGRAADGAAVDLHRTLPGLREVSPEQAWRVLERRREPLELGGGVVDALDAPGRLLLAALHVTHHTLHYPGDVRKPLEDLRRAVAQVGDDAWRAGLTLAESLDATARFTVGLRQAEGGEELADRIGAPSPTLLTSLDPESSAPLALGFNRLAGAATWGERARIVRKELLPSPSYMRFTSQRARSGMRGLAAEYGHRFARVARYAGPSYLAWRRARRP